jgi:hypothetical protein
MSSQITHGNENSCSKVSNLAPQSAVDKSNFLDNEIGEKQGVTTIS